jgi:hypothetical protein
MKQLKRSECAVLPLVLKGKWYDMIASGKKKEEYRDATKYWRVRVSNWSHYFYEKPSKIPVVEFRLGYASSAPRMAFTAKRGVFGFWQYNHSWEVSHPEWGEPETSHYVIRLGERVELVD